MSRQLPPLNALKAFEAAARHLSFTKAAEELFVTQAAISHQIKTLEEYLGLKLFRRRNRSLSLTEDGQGYYQEIRSIFSAICEATERLMARNAKGTLTITTPPGFAIQWLVPRLMQFSQLHPEIDVRIKAVDQDEGTLIDDVDLAIYYGDGNWPDLLLYKLHSGYRIPAGDVPILPEKQQTLASHNAYYLVMAPGHDTQGKVAAFRDWIVALLQQEDNEFMSWI